MEEWKCCGKFEKKGASIELATFRAGNRKIQLKTSTSRVQAILDILKDMPKALNGLELGFSLE